MDNIGDNINVDEENWHYVEISKIDDTIIKKLVNNLQQNLSEEFYLSFESLLKLGKKAAPELMATISEMDEQHKFKKEIFKALLKYINTKTIENPKIFQLYHPDFEIRARAVMELGQKDNSKNLKFLLPLIKDPDDSVRWAVINLLINKYLKNPQVYKKLKKHVNKESNPIIRKKLTKVIEEL